MSSDNNPRDKGHPDSTIRFQALWFEDGSVIIHAQNTQFRVHRSILSMHSKVFRDMFSVPQPENEPTIEGCPVVYLADNEEDWEVILNLLYNVWNMPQSLYEYGAPVLISMLRIGHKYQFDNLKKYAYGRLESEIPTNFVEWNSSALSVAHEAIEEQHEYFIRGYEVDLINIAIEIDMQKFLPMLYYLALKNLKTTDILDGALRRDGTVAHLSRGAQRVLIIGMENIRAAIMQHNLSWLFDHRIATVNVNNCSQCDINRAKILVFITPSLTWDISLALQDPPETATVGLCDACVELVVVDMAVGRERLWNELPSYFGLPAWDTLLTEEV